MIDFICLIGESHNQVTMADVSQTHMSHKSTKTNAVIAHTHPPPDSPFFQPWHAGDGCLCWRMICCQKGASACDQRC